MRQGLLLGQGQFGQDAADQRGSARSVLSKGKSIRWLVLARPMPATSTCKSNSRTAPG